MKTILYSFMALVTLFIAPSCDKLDEPYTRQTGGDVSRGRKVLLEEFTGHKCPNCPEASLLAHELQHDNPEVILLSVHAGVFAIPNAAGAFSTDFRCKEGDELNTFFAPSSYPSGMVNRTSYNGKTVMSQDFWNNAIASFKQTDPVASLLLTSAYDTNTRAVQATVKANFLENYGGPLDLVIYITEDSIIKPQYNNNPVVGPTPYITDYVHRHMLRTSFSGTWGVPFTPGPVTYGTSKEMTLTATLDTAWNDRQCYMVAFLQDKASREVMQVEEKRIR